MPSPPNLAALQALIGDKAKVDAAPATKHEDVELRRQRVVQLRLRKMTLRAIAAVVGVDESTVSRDLKEIRERWQQLYGAKPELDASEMVGESLELYAEAESLALLEYTNLGQTAKDRRLSPMFAARQRMACLRTAMTARQLAVNLLQDLGLMERQLGTLGVAATVGSATEIRRRLIDGGIKVTEDDLTSDGERAWKTGQTVAGREASA